MAAPVPFNLQTGDIALGSSGADASTGATVSVQLAGHSAASGQSSIGGIGSLKKFLFFSAAVVAIWFLTRGAK